MKQMDRRLLILTRLREEAPLRAADLAQQCECSVRTVYRDIDALCHEGGLGTGCSSSISSG